MCRRGIVTALLLFFASVAVQAQELRCTQMFMNKAEKAICASGDLMELDKQMGLLAHRAERSQPGYRSSQSEFRRALKKCQSDDVCLRSTYHDRIQMLTEYVMSLPAPDASEQAHLTVEATKAQEKRDAQEWRREELALESEANAPDAITPALDESPDSQVAPISNQSESVDLADSNSPQVEVPPAIDQIQSDPDSTGIMGMSWWLIGAIFIIGLAIIQWLRGVLSRQSEAEVRRQRACPQCGRWDARKQIDEDRESYQTHEIRNFKDVKRNRDGQVISTVERQQPVLMNMERITDTWECVHCQHRWRTTTECER